VAWTVVLASVVWSISRVIALFLAVAELPQSLTFSVARCDRNIVNVVIISLMEFSSDFTAGAIAALTIKVANIASMWTVNMIISALAEIFITSSLVAVDLFLIAMRVVWIRECVGVAISLVAVVPLVARFALVSRASVMMLTLTEAVMFAEAVMVIMSIAMMVIVVIVMTISVVIVMTISVVVVVIVVTFLTMVMEVKIEI